jgi:hypothetical protein
MGICRTAMIGLGNIAWKLDENTGCSALPQTHAGAYREQTGDQSSTRTSAKGTVFSAKEGRRHLRNEARRLGLRPEQMADPGILNRSNPLPQTGAQPA